MDYDNMSKEELIAKLKELEKQRAFTYEDQMKLTILDESPFTIWASDRDCKITLWEGRCEALYGYTRDYAIGKDYISLFVAPDEQPAAKLDQISIIDNAEKFHNIANDEASAGNTLHLITNCFRIKDPRTGQYWNAEMGLIIDYLEQEQERLEHIVAESKRIKSCITLFIENTQRRKSEYQERKKSIRAGIDNSRIEAAKIRKLSSFMEKIVPINNSLKILNNKLNQLIDDYYQKIQTCTDVNSCEAIILVFDEEYEKIIDGLEEIAAGFEVINSEFNWDNSLMQLRDDMLKINFDSSRRLDNFASELLNKAEEDISEYRRLGVKSESIKLIEYTKRRDNIQLHRNSIMKILDECTGSIQRTTDSDKLSSFRFEIIDKYKDIEDKLSKLKRMMEGGVDVS
jgi:PAS domain S-box-containing protein